MGGGLERVSAASKNKDLYKVRYGHIYEPNTSVGPGACVPSQGTAARVYPLPQILNDHAPHG